MKFPNLIKGKNILGFVFFQSKFLRPKKAILKKVIISSYCLMSEPRFIEFFFGILSETNIVAILSKATF